MTPKISKFVVFRRIYESGSRRREYIIKNPDSDVLAVSSSMENPSMHAPEHTEQQQAEWLVQQLNAENPGAGWATELAPNACPSCARKIWADDLDFIYPDNRDGTRYRAGCNVHDFGCGFELFGTNYEDVVLKWNSAQLFDYEGRSYSRPEGKGKVALEAELRTVFNDYPEYSDPDYGPANFLAMVNRFAQDNFYNLHFVARQYLKLLEPRVA